MLNGVKFDGTHSYDDLGIIVASKEIGPPEVQTHYIEVPGRNGPLDFTEALTGEVKYNSRSIKINFNTTESICKISLPELITKVASVVHGKRLKIVFDDDPDCYYMGRCLMDAPKRENGKISFTLNCTCDPYKYDESGKEIL